MIPGAVCTAERQPGNGERKPIAQTLRLGGNSHLPLKHGTVCFQTEARREQGLSLCWISDAGVGLTTKQNYIQV